VAKLIEAPIPLESPNLPTEIPSRAKRWLVLGDEALKEAAKGRRGRARAKQNGVVRRPQQPIERASESPKKRKVA